MDLLLEQYEKEATISSNYVSGVRPIVPEMTSGGIINARLEDDTPIFKKHKIMFKPTDPISHLVAANNIVVIGMKNKTLMRIDLVDAEHPEDIELSRSLGEKSYQAKLYQLFLDPKGQHIIVSLVISSNSGHFSNLYIGPGSRKPQELTKAKGHVISAIAWNFGNRSDDSTSFILVGTTKGIIFETELTKPDDRVFFASTNVEVYFKQVFDFQLKGDGGKVPGLDNEGPITGIEFHQIGSSVSDKRYFILVTTPSRLYQLVGTVPLASETPYLLHIFTNNPGIIDQFQQFPGNLGYSTLSFFYPSPGAAPKTFAWMTEPGVFYGEIDGAGQQTAMNPVTKDTEHLQFSLEQIKEKKPLAAIKTEFHILVLFQDRLRAFCTLYRDPDTQLVLEEVFNESYGSGNMVGMTKDPVKGTIWAFSEMTVYRYKVMQEDRNVWEAYLSLEKYDLAKKYCKDDAAKLDKVLTKQAQDCFAKKQYEESALLFAQTHSSFEEIALKFLQNNQEGALKVFLQKKLDSLKLQEKTQITMLVMWLMEMYLTRIGAHRHEAAHHKTDEHKRLQAEFHQFLALPKVKDCAVANRGAIYSLMASHGDEENLIHFAVLMKDYERVIQYHLQHKNFVAALDVLKNQNRPELFYQFSQILMKSQPAQTVTAWIAQGNLLNPVKLIPAMVQDDVAKNAKQGSHTLKYLEYCVYDLQNKEESIHNYLLSLYAQTKHEKLMKYLNWQGQDPALVNYDLKYALRLCSDLELDKACVHICSTMGLYEEAVSLALKFDVELAKQNAEKPDDNEELRKKLWLKIACHVVNKERDIKQAMEFLHECDLLKIEDILPFFSDFVTIDHFKEAICSSLQEYNQHIEGLKNEMEEATQSAQDIRSEIQSFRKKHAVVAADDKCTICAYAIMSKPFYLFPCKHLFHTDCLINEILSSLTPTKRARIDEIQRQLDTLGLIKDDAISVSSGITGLGYKDRMLSELDDLIASECPYCGDLMIRRIDAPFIDPGELQQIAHGWD